MVARAEGSSQGLDLEMILDRTAQVVVVEVGIDFGRRDVAMTEQNLHLSNIRAAHK